MPASENSFTLNGETRPCPSGQNPAALLQELGLDPGKVVVEINRHILKPEELESTPLNAGDQVEIIHFVGGG